MTSHYGLKALKGLTVGEKMELVMFRHTATYGIVGKMMDAIVEISRNEAMEVPPHEKEKRLAAMDVAFAAKKCFEDFRSAIDVLIEEHLQDIKLQAAKKALEDAETIEKIIVRQ